ncbi:MAG: phage head spike fiber domain-containing protein [Acidobacteriaceae bacterium]
MGPIPGLPGQIWTQFLAAMAYFQNNLDSANPENSLGLIEGMSATCTNALDALTAYSYYTAASLEYGLLSTVLTYNLLYPSPAQTNLQLYSQSDYTTQWQTGVNGAAYISSDALAPDGSSTAGVCQSASSIYPQTTTAGSTLVSGINTFSFFIAPYNGQTACNGYLSWNSGTNTPYTSNNFQLDFSTGTITNVSPGNGFTYTVTPCANGFFRVDQTFDFPDNVAVVSVILWTQSAAGAGGVVLWGAQAEVGSVANSYIPTTTSASSIYEYYMTLVESRITALQSFLSALNNMPLISLVTNLSVLGNGQSVITGSTDMAAFLYTYDFENYPYFMDGLDQGTLSSNAQAMVDAWQSVIDAIPVSHLTNTGLVYDSCQRMLESSTVILDEINNAVADTTISGSNAVWNFLVSMPSVCRFVAESVNDPSSLLSQQISVTRHVILGAMAQLNTLILSIKAQLSSNIAVATLPMGKTLMDVAAAKLGNYEDWTSIAAVNQLNPPYIGVGANLAAPGSRIFLQAPTTSSGTPVSPPNYEINYLGIDLYYGPLNQDMLPWTGDFQTIQGYKNLSLSLGRRLQTTLGTLMYDSEFGSRIPPEIGEIQSQDTAAHILAYASSALLSDPRSQTVASASVIRNPDGSINYSGVVIPNGSSGNGANVNEVLQPI